MTLVDRVTFGTTEQVWLRLPACVAPRRRDGDELRADLLRALHPTGYRNLRVLRRGAAPYSRNIAVADLETVNEIVVGSQGMNVYVGVATRGEGQDGGLQNCRALWALFADLDFKDSSEAGVRARLGAFPLTPSAVVGSGGGLQTYWFLKEPIDLQNGGSDYAKRLLRALAKALGGDLNSAEPAHILRLPDTLNYKYDPPRPVGIEALRDTRYDLDALAHELPFEDEPEERDERTKVSFDRAARLRLAQLYLSFRPPAIQGSGGDAHTYATCCAVAVGHDLTEDDAFEALRGWNARCQPPWSEGELRQKIRNAVRYGRGRRGEKLTFPPTETGDAEFFASLHAGRVAYDAHRARWLLLDDDGLWTPDPVEQLRCLAVDAMRARRRHACEIEDRAASDKMFNWAWRGEGTQRLTNMLREARTRPEIRNDSQLDPWDPDPWLLGVRAGGVVDLRTGELRKAQPDERVTMRAGSDFDPEARSDLWEQTLREIFEDDDELVAYLQRCGGYSLTGDVREDKWFISHGKHGREGKGTLYGAWASAMGDYMLELPSAVFDLHRPQDYDLANLPGKRFVTSSETGNTIHLNHDRIKRITGGDRIRAANKYQRSFEFQPSCKLWLACNDLPRVTDDSRAFWARVIVFPFRRSFEGHEKRDLRPTLRDDRAHRRAVLAWLVRGAVIYAREGLGPMPRAVREATEDFRDESWPLTAFVQSDCIEAPDASVSVKDFNGGYQRFCEQQGIPRERRLGWKTVQKLMEGRYETQMGLDRRKQYVGITLRDAIQDFPDL